MCGVTITFAMEWTESFMLTSDGLKKEQYDYQNDRRKDGGFQLCSGDAR